MFDVRLSYPPTALARLGSWLTVVCLSLLPACSSAPQQDYALEAPVVSPPAHATVEERIQYWEDRLPAMGRADQAEARICLGELHLEAGNASLARINFNAAGQGSLLSAREEAQVNWGIGRSYLLEQRRQQALPYLQRAASQLDGPEGAECDYLLGFARGRTPSSDDQALLRRVAPFTGGDSAAPRLAAASSNLGSDLIDLSRRDWGANRLLANHDPMSRPYRITVHHTAEPAHTHTHESTVREMRDLQRMHQQDRGWADLGYHFMIDQAGRIVEGRPLTAQGAHAGDSDLNRGNIGICLIGNFVSQPDRGSDYAIAQAPTSEQMQALEKLVSELQARYAIRSNQIWSHSHLKETACPGPELEAWVQRWRQR